ncbi:Mce family protein [Rhodococcus sp. RD6.2]|uniref:MCE family protein n=1 Tax=Rhodococcus sp. RD6.2 TaxID=260936 RepID=UPI00063B253C|nr:MCE family protein [Rhodococcus sp. RD6.2]CRK49339.1 Mce family protein [Rhodococcus sp. RD6.2]
MIATRVAAFVMAALLAGLAMLTYLAYSGQLSGNVIRVRVEADRAGLLLQTGSLVKYHGVEVGRVADVASDNDLAVIHVELSEDAAGGVPSDVGAAIAATTVFGSKQVTLTDPPAPAATMTPIADGTVIPATSVSTETNSILDRLNRILTVVQPDQLQATLTATATALRGQGESIGHALDDLDVVLGALEPTLGALSADLRSGAPVAETLGAATPELLAAARSLTTTADTVVAQRDSLDALLVAATGLADVGTPVLSDNTAALTESLSRLRPTTELFEEYSPGLTCFIQGADVARIAAEKISGGNRRTMLLNSTIVWGVDAYTYPDDLPEVRATGGPRCGALPELTMADVPAPYVAADTGADVFAHNRASPTIDPDTLFAILMPPPTSQPPVGGR